MMIEEITERSLNPDKTLGEVQDETAIAIEEVALSVEEQLREIEAKSGNTLPAGVVVLKLSTVQKAINYLSERPAKEVFDILLLLIAEANRNQSTNSNN